VSKPAPKSPARPNSTRKSALAIVCAAAGLLPATAAQPQQPTPASPEVALSGALSAGCRQDPAAFANFLTSDNAAAYRALPAPQRTAFMKRFVLLEDPGRPLLSTSATGHPVVRCESPGISTEMRFGETRSRENLAFIPMEIPLPGEPSRSITFGLVREGGNWKLLSLGLVLLDIPSMEKQWQQADNEAREDQAIAALRKLATALETYRRAYGKLPDALDPLGPAPKGEISPEAAGLIDADLSAGNKNGYAIRYRIVPAGGNLPEEDANQAAKFELAATPIEYGKTGLRSFFLDSGGILRGADKQGAVATSADPRMTFP
jgi:type II secretory pathway pseudopilin PulG